MKNAIDKIWDQHVIKSFEDNNDLIFIDHHYIHEVTSPQAFSELEKEGKKVMFPNRITATADHNIPTIDQDKKIQNDASRLQVEALRTNCKNHGIELYDVGHQKNGIVHVIGPENGITRPGMTIVCGDSHTSTHGALGCIAFGIGTSQVKQVLAAQSLILKKPKTMSISVNGQLNKYVTAKDVILYIISKLGAEGATGHFVEYRGSTFRDMSIEERMTVCNMSIEMGARGGLVSCDETTIDYLNHRVSLSQEKIEEYLSYSSSKESIFDKNYEFDAKDIGPMITTGPSPDTGIEINNRIDSNTKNTDQGLNYMGFKNEASLIGQKVDYIFIGSCTNSRIEDLREVANFTKGKKAHNNTRVWIVPGSNKVKQQAEAEGLDKIFIDAGFEFRQPGCSACLAMNDDKIPEGSICVSTSNRNFEGRQGKGSKTILASPITAAAAAISGVITDPRTLIN